MAILKILRMGHPLLYQRAAVVEDPKAPEIRQLSEDMVETMLAEPGAGLAAPQVGKSLRMLVYRVTPERAKMESGSAANAIPDTTLINPEIEFLDETRDYAWEGCLSVLPLIGWVGRARRIRVRATGLNGENLDFEAEGFHARLLQHEFDHLNGILVPQRLDDIRHLVFSSERQHYGEVSALPGRQD